jgi:hypothetical protein
MNLQSFDIDKALMEIDEEHEECEARRLLNRVASGPTLHQSLLD